MRNRDNQMKLPGFTLAEIIVATGIGLVIMAVSLRAISDFMANQNNAAKLYNLQIAADTIFVQLTQDIHQADTIDLDLASNMFTLTNGPKATPTKVIYSWEPVTAKDPTHLVLRRDGTILHSPNVSLLDIPGNDLDFVINTNNPDFKGEKEAAPTLPMLLFTFTLEHQNPQGARAVYEATSNISFRNHHIAI
jgi:type II secretory pathway pseudopilin PulG